MMLFDHEKRAAVTLKPMGSLEETSQGSRAVPCYRRDGQELSVTSDTVIAEEPLELRVDGAALATIMRTPGHDQELAMGFFFSEGWISSRVDVGSLAYCAREASGQGAPAPGADQDAAAQGPPLGNAVDLLSPQGRRHQAPAARLPVSSSCGVCGKRTIDEVLARTPLAATASAQVPAAKGTKAQGPPTESATTRLTTATLKGLPDALRRRQVLFDETGSVHAAGLFRPDGTNLVVREDVGRHNAVDKVIGWALLEGAFPLSGTVLQVSGRTSFEIVQKAHAAGIPIICGVSGVSSLAVELAERASITLIGFVRGTAFTVYSCPDRVAQVSERPAAGS